MAEFPLNTVFTPQQFPGTRVILIQPIGVFLKTRGIPEAEEEYVYRCLVLNRQSMNNPDLNEVSFAVKVVLDDEQALLPSEFSKDVKLSMQMKYFGDFVRTKLEFQGNGYKLFAFELMGNGSLYNAIVRRFGCKMQEKWIAHILLKVLHVLQLIHGDDDDDDDDNSGGSHGSICASQVFINFVGKIKVGYAATMFTFFDDYCNVGPEWPYNVKPSGVGSLKPPELHPEYMQDLNPKKVDSWRVGVLALELIYSGLRINTENFLYEEVNRMRAKGRFPHAIEDRKIRDDGTTWKASKRHDYEFSKEFKQLVFDLLNPQVDLRPTCTDAMAYPLFNKYPTLKEEDILWE